MCNERNMAVQPPIVYDLQLKDGKVVQKRLEGRLVRTFRWPATQPGLQKLYVVKHADSIVYVGQTRRPIAERLRGGFGARGEHGYWGYQWKALESVDLLIWHFPGEEEKRVEATEAELVYLVRKNTGQWPQFQTEIHFHNVPSARDAARAIYATLRERDNAEGSFGP